jgi:hypothetical protein
MHKSFGSAKMTFYIPISQHGHKKHPYFDAKMILSAMLLLLVVVVVVAIFCMSDHYFLFVVHLRFDAFFPKSNIFSYFGDKSASTGTVLRTGFYTPLPRSTRDTQRIFLEFFFI